MRKNGFSVVEILIIIAVVSLLAIILAGMPYQRLTCKNGHDVPTNDGSMDCYGGDTYKHCKPATRFVCLDE